MTWLAVLQPSETPPWLNLVLLAVFFGMPILARILKAVLGRAGIDLEEKGQGAGRTARRTRRAEQRRSEDEGEDLWRRLLRGEEAAPPPEPRQARPPVVTKQPREEPRHAPRSEPRHRPLEQEVRAPEGTPLPALAASEVRAVSPAVVPDMSTLRDRPPQLSSRIAGTTLRVRAQQAGPARVQRRFFRGRRDLRRAFVLVEVLGEPVSERGLGRGHLEWGH